MNPENFENCILIATPYLDDKNFRRTVTYVFSHNETGAAGLVINQPLDFPFEAVLKNLSIEKAGENSNLVQVCRGGPVAPESGFLLHENTNSVLEESRCVAPGIHLANSRRCLEQFAISPLKTAALFAIGYASWGPKQLEHEILQGNWFCNVADKAIIFDIPFKDRWNFAIQQLGVDANKISPDIGHA